LLLLPGIMARRLRYIPPNSVVEVTTRTIQGRFLLRPSPELNALILGIIGRALTRYAVQVHALAFLSNHYHMLLSVADAQALSKFMEYVNGNIAKEAGRMHGWKDKFWARRYQAIVVADEAAQQDRLRYILSHGCKEGLVARAADWPGIHCATALTEGTPLRGIWFDRSAAYEAGRRRMPVKQADFSTEYTVSLTPLPCYAHLSSESYKHVCTEIVAEIEGAVAERGGEPLGRAGVLRQYPHDRPQQPERSPAPLVHAALRRTRAAFVAAYRWFEACYRDAAARVRQGQRDVRFPQGAFPPPAPFVSLTAPFASSAPLNAASNAPPAPA
jgi:REP element-mobilizing transposase RayT